MKLKGTVNAFEFAINGQITNQSVLDAVSESEAGTEIKFPKGEYAFDPMVLNKSVRLNFSGSQLMNKGTGDLFTFKGGLSGATYSLSTPAKRKVKVLRLNAQAKDIAAGDLILLKDDTVRHYDGLPDINSEVHEVLHVQGNNNVSFCPSMIPPRIGYWAGITSLDEVNTWFQMGRRLDRL
jgi:hypothetical protein